MNPSRTLFFPLIISLLLCSCSSVKELGTHDAAEKDSILRFSPLGSISEPLLFKASIGISGDHYSGLFLIKRMPGNSSVRVVFMSELGINLLDLEYRNDEFEVVSVEEFLNKPPVLKTLQHDFRTLLLDLSTIGSYSVTEMDGGTTGILQFKHKSQKYRYYSKEGPGTYRIERKKGLFRRVEFVIGGGEDLEIVILHRGGRLQVDLHQLRQFSDHAD